MFARRLVQTARQVQLHRLQPRSHVLPIMTQLRTYAEIVVKVPQMAESISEGSLMEWPKQVGDYVEQDEEIASIETDKMNVAVNAPEAGTIKELLANDGDTVVVGQPLLKIETGGAPAEGGDKEAPKETSDDKPSESKSESASAKESQEPAPSKPAEPEQSPPKESPKPSPKADAKPAAKQDTKSSTKETPAAKPAFGSREEHRVKMNRMRLRIAERLKQSQNTAATLTTMNDVDMSSLMEFRKLYKDDVLKKTGVKLGFMSAFARACCLAMREFPVVNASIEGPGGGDTIVYRDYVDISVAVATEKGLVTPVIRNVESLDMVGVEKAIADMAKKARDNKLQIEDMAGGTFTISNGGVYGSLMGTPIINLPQSAILGLHRIEKRAVVINDKIEIRPMMTLALSYDHRIMDGREAVLFLVRVKEFIEDPRRMLL